MVGALLVRVAVGVGGTTCGGLCSSRSVGDVRMRDCRGGRCCGDGGGDADVVDATEHPISLVVHVGVAS
jgi:hypothetical protein